jgi:tripartite-type tricarboxylate transporter receptor subunit TctC
LSPATPGDRFKTLRQAFTKAISNPDVVSDAERKKLEIDPTPGEELEVLAKEVIAQPPEVVERMRKMLAM